MPKGSTLGRKLFLIYCGGLRDVINDGLVAYADYAYVLISGKDTNDLKDQAELEMIRHVTWLESIGMVVNISKTESVLFSRKPEPSIVLNVCGSSFSSTNMMKVLRVTFDVQLSWKPQVEKV